MKVCNICSDLLVLGENWSYGNARWRNNRCKECSSTAAKKWQAINPEQHHNNCKNWQHKNHDKHRKLVIDWNSKNYDRLKYTTKLWNEGEGYGVYVVELFGVPIYVGQGQLKARKNKHLTVKGKGNKSLVYLYSKQHNINRKYLSFNVLEYCDDKSRRLEIERYYKRILNPIIP